jgi:GNAT superfamily N-acetyltransferase
MPTLTRAAVEIVDLDAAHLPQAAELYASDFALRRGRLPLLRPEQLDTGAVELLLRRAIEAGPSVAAVRDGSLTGFMVGFPVPGLRGSGMGVHVPEWAHSVAGGERAATYESLYAVLSARWVAAGWLNHFVSVLADDPELEHALVGLGFGMFAADAVRSLDPVAVDVTPDVTIRRADPGDVDALVPLVEAHDAFYALAPTFLFRRPAQTPRQQLNRWITSPGESVWAAWAGGEPLAFLYVRPPQDDVCLASRQKGTVAIGAAFTSPDARGTGVATALLSHVVDWASSAGFERLSVDFETANLLARRFWLRFFSPVCLSFERHLDDRLAGRLTETPR